MKLSTQQHPLISASLWFGLYFILSGLMNIAFGYELSVLYSALFSCLLVWLWRQVPRLQKVIIGLYATVAAMYLPFALVWGSPNFNTLLALRSTNFEESTEMATLFPWHSYLLSLLIIALAVCAIRRSIIGQRCWKKADTFLLLLGLSGFLITPITNAVNGGTFKWLDAGYPAFRFVKDTFVNNAAVKREEQRMEALSHEKDTWEVTSVNPKYQVFVVVIGESVRRDALGAFGGEWDNTPFASNVKGKLFLNYVAASGSTQKSLGLTLNRVENGEPIYQDNFVTLANRAGFKTWWFSNQGQIGKYDSAIASIAKRADEVYFLKNGDFEANKNSDDKDLLTLTRQVLESDTTTPQLVVLHLMGSHPQACDRTHGHYETFVHSKEISCYLYSVKQTDELLEQVYKQLEESGKSFSMVYFSDHGMTVKERGKPNEYLAHDDKYQQNFQVPFMVISSDDKAHHVIKARRSANDFLPFFAEWTGIHTNMRQLKYHFISEQKAPPIYITNFLLKPVDYDKLGQDKFTP